MYILYKAAYTRLRVFAYARDSNVSMYSLGILCTTKSKNCQQKSIFCKSNRLRSPNREISKSIREISKSISVGPI